MCEEPFLQEPKDSSHLSGQKCSGMPTSDSVTDQENWIAMTSLDQLEFISRDVDSMIFLKSHELGPHTAMQ